MNLISIPVDRGRVGSGIFVSNDGGQTFVFQIVPDPDALAIEMRLPKGAGSYNGEDTLAVNRTIGIVPNILAKDEPTNWWWFNEALGTVDLTVLIKRWCFDRWGHLGSRCEGRNFRAICETRQIIYGKGFIIL